MIGKIKELLIGPPLRTQEMAGTRLNNIRALAAFSPDALSSIAYANQEIYLGLVVAGSVGLAMALPIGLAITGLLIIVAVSYYQTIQAYPSGGGSYIVARANLGTLPGLMAAGALMIDYLLTAAVSLTAGVEAIASAFPVLWSYRVAASLALLVVITLINLRGMQETGTALSIPVYFFLISFLAMLLYGAVKAVLQGPGIPPFAPPAAIQPLSTLLVLRTFAAGCTALTGIEAISNGVPAFRPPESRNAGKTLIVMAFLMGALLAGSIGLTQYFGVVSNPQETILAALARTLLGTGPAFYIVQIATLLILAVAANTSFADFPRVAAILAKDGFMPRQLTGLGDRLVFANGISLLALGTALLIVVFNGDTHALIPLFAIGAFLAFTFSQTGMVVHWLRLRSAGWHLKALINGVGAVTTGTAVIIIAISKFVNGAWISIFLIPIIVMFFYSIHSHYREVTRELTLHGLPPSLRPKPPPRIVVPISGVSRAVIEAVMYALSFSHDVTAVYIELEPGKSVEVKKDWECWLPDVPLVILDSPYRSIVRPLMDYLDKIDEEINDGQSAAVVLPEFVPARWWQSLLHNQTAFLIRTALLYRRRRFGHERVIIDVPFHLSR
ncbi:MAG: APC family permease [Chloroflexi bacterium]|nr:APC family permease [Chloroflexota bacterium]